MNAPDLTLQARLDRKGFALDVDIRLPGRGITALFGLSNRMANVTGMRPNDEFYLMGRVPKAGR